VISVVEVATYIQHFLAVLILVIRGFGASSRGELAHLVFIIYV
jgi:hypothetical protein